MTAGGYHEIRRGRGGNGDGVVLGWVERLNAKKNEEGHLMIEFCPEGYIDRLCSDITLNRRDMRSKFGYITLYKIPNPAFKIKHKLFKDILCLNKIEKEARR